MAKPKLDDLWKHFPDHTKYRTMADLYNMLGGAAKKNINVPGFGPNGNACASRISVALALSGHKINPDTAKAAGARTLGTDKGYRIIYGVADLRRYLLAVFGSPATDRSMPYHDAFAGKKGIIAFQVTGWSDASGHIALYNGKDFREPAYDNYAEAGNPRPPARTTSGEFWEMGS